jgi:hypothetical protein
MLLPSAIGSTDHLAHSICAGGAQVEGRSPRLGEHLRINAESFSDQLEFVFLEITFPGDIASQTALGYITKPLAEFFVRDIAAQHFNLCEQMMAKVPFHGRPPETESCFENTGLRRRTRMRRPGYS